MLRGRGSLAQTACKLCGAAGQAKLQLPRSLSHIPASHSSMTQRPAALEASATTQPSSTYGFRDVATLPPIDSALLATMAPGGGAGSSIRAKIEAQGL